MTSDREGFLGRWSRLKREGAKPAGPVAPPVVPADAGASRPEEVLRESELASAESGNPATDPREAGAEAAQPLDLSKLPKIEELTAQSDIRAFLDKRVPEALRNAALRQMWTLDPAIRDFIEVAENQWNWNVPGGAPGYEMIDAATTDMATLLAQATGAITRQENSDHENVSGRAENSPVDIKGAGNAAPPHAAAHNRRPVSDAEASSSALATAEQQPDHPAAARPHTVVAMQRDELDAMALPEPAPRRHGSALPI